MLFLNFLIVKVTSNYIVLKIISAKVTSSPLIILRSQAMLIDEWLNDGYDFVLTARLQSDLVERRFSQYRQMSGERFLVNLREVLNTEWISSCRSLIK